MNTVLVDTDVFSFILKGDSRATAYLALLQGNRLALSFMSVAELYQWAAIRNWGSQRVEQLEQTFANYLIIPVDIHLCRVWGNLRADRQKAGRTIASQDAWIAATALHYKLPLVTHNAGDFQEIQGLNLQTIAG